MLRGRVEGSEAVIVRLLGKATKTENAVVRRMDVLSWRLHRKITAEKLSGQVLRNRTGNLRRAVFPLVPARRTEFSIVGGAALGRTGYYGKAHEFGLTLHIPEIRPVNAKALHWKMGGRDIFAMFARAHTVKMPQRSFMRSALRELAPMIRAELADAAREGIS